MIELFVVRPRGQIRARPAARIFAGVVAIAPADTQHAAYPLNRFDAAGLAGVNKAIVKSC